MSAGAAGPNPIEILKLALLIAVLAPTVKESDEACELAGEVVKLFGIPAEGVEEAKKAVEEFYMAGLSGDPREAAPLP